jgi:hypothetical protein
MMIGSTVVRSSSQPREWIAIVASAVSLNKLVLPSLNAAGTTIDARLVMRHTWPSSGTSTVTNSGEVVVSCGMAARAALQL